jgi:hypothetical protein
MLLQAEYARLPNRPKALGITHLADRRDFQTTETRGPLLTGSFGAGRSDLESCFWETGGSDSEEYGEG